MLLKFIFGQINVTFSLMPSVFGCLEVNEGCRFLVWSPPGKRSMKNPLVQVGSHHNGLIKITNRADNFVHYRVEFVKYHLVLKMSKLHHYTPVFWTVRHHHRSYCNLNTRSSWYILNKSSFIYVTGRKAC